MPELSVVVGTLNEAGNLPLLVSSLDEALTGLDWELIVVDDDSPDGTAELARSIAQKDPRVRVLQRIWDRGLASACIQGMLASSAPYLAVMDADLQHDPAMLPVLLERLRRDDLDLVIGSRFAEGASLRQGLSQQRETMSRLANWLSRRIVAVETQDLMSGYFLLTRRFFEQVDHRLSGLGFKILLDILASAPTPPRVAELPIDFRARNAGTSKLDAVVSVELLMLIADKLIGGAVPPRFVLFVGVGASGVLVHALALGLFYAVLGLSFIASQALAILIAMTTNFFVNNFLTFRDVRLKGVEMWTGLGKFYVYCSMGALISLQSAVFAQMNGVPWLPSGLLGAIVAAVWNFAINSLFTWRLGRKRRSAQRAERAS